MKAHDTLFRTMCAHQDIQQDMVRVALPELADRIQMDSVCAVQDTFTQGAQADLLLSATTEEGKDLLIYILVEHKSYPDRGVALQLWGYMHRIWNRWWQDPETRHARTPLPRIHPVVLYHGRRQWKVPTRLSALHAPGGRPWADLEYKLVDLAAVEPSEYLIGARSLAFFIIMKHTLRIMTHRAAQTILEALSDSRVDKGTREILVDYLTRNTPQQNVPVLLETTKKMQYLTEGGRTVMTMAEALLEEGLKKGRAESLRSVARTMLKKELSIELINETTGLSMEEIHALRSDEALDGGERQED